MSETVDRSRRLAALAQAAAERVLVLDGAMGSLIQGHKLDEADFRGARFRDFHREVKGNNDLLNLTRPDVIRSLHQAYVDAGADLIETNTFNSTSISQADYDMADLAYELNRAGAALAREVCLAAEARDGRTRWVVGAIGPTSKTASISPDVNDPGYRAVDFDDLCRAYREAAQGLIDGGCDLLLVETVFDTLNAKAALFAIDELLEETGLRLPVMVSGTITDRSGRTLSGQTPEAFWASLRHARPFSIGLNCALGADLMRPYIAEIARVADTLVSAYPNAGLPNAFGEYDETPDQTAGHLGEWARSGLVNIVGGCCGTTPEHIARIAASVKGLTPRTPPAPRPQLQLSGLEPFAFAAF